MFKRAFGIAAPCAAGTLALVALGSIAAPTRGADIAGASRRIAVAKTATAIPIEVATEQVAEVTAELIREVSNSSAPASLADEKFIWPVKGAINTSFGGGHDGVDIEGETGDQIVAARSGKIVFAGDDGDGYGTKILISHPGGMRTLYSHLSSISVHQGWVDRGTVIGRVGCTGSCTGDHLHFEIQRGETAVDPAPFLP